MPVTYSKETTLSFAEKAAGVVASVSGYAVEKLGGQRTVTMPTIEFFSPRELGKKDWGTELLVAETEHYIGKCMWMKAGAGGPLQYHERKDEAFFLFSGRALLRYKDANGDLTIRELRAGMSVHIPPGAVHQVEALEDCVMFETSTPVFDDRVPA